jgi:hypothetical protein
VVFFYALRLLPSMTFLPRIPSNQLLFLLQLRKSNWLEGIQDKTIRMMARSVLLVFYIELKHALRLLPSRATSAWQVSLRIPSVRPTFLLQPKKSKQKSPLANRRAMFFIQLFMKFSRSSQCAPATLRLNLHPCKLTY